MVLRDVGFFYDWFAGGGRGFFALVGLGTQMVPDVVESTKCYIR